MKTIGKILQVLKRLLLSIHLGVTLFLGVCKDDNERKNGQESKLDPESSGKENSNDSKFD